MRAPVYPARWGAAVTYSHSDGFQASQRIAVCHYNRHIFVHGSDPAGLAP